MAKKRKFVAELLLDDGSRIALAKSGAFAYLEDNKEEHLAYAALAGELPVVRITFAPPAFGRALPYGYRAFAVRQFVNLYVSAMGVNPFPASAEEARRQFTASLVPFAPMLVQARHCRDRRQARWRQRTRMWAKEVDRRLSE